MNKQEKLDKIKESFDSAPSLFKLQERQGHLNGLRDAAQEVQAEIDNLRVKVNKEEGKIANKLDKEIPGWRALVRQDWLSGGK